MVKRSDKFFIVKFVVQSFIEKKQSIKIKVLNKYIKLKMRKLGVKYIFIDQKFTEKKLILNKEVYSRKRFTFVSYNAPNAP
jgi:hypothetical protein